MATNCKKVFISYNSSDHKVNEFVKQLKRKLEDDGCDKAFIFQSAIDNPPGEKWIDKIAKEIETCDAFVAIITKGYLNSDICYYEFYDAHITHKKRVIPIIFEDPIYKPHFSKEKYAAGIRFLVRPIGYVTFKKPEMEDNPYNNLLIGLGLKDAEPGTDETDNGPESGSDNISFIDCQAASTALVQCTDTIAESNIESNDLARKLSSDLIITETFYQRITDRACRDTKKERLEAILFELKDRVKNDASVLTKFVDILREKFKRNDLADKIMSECTKAGETAGERGIDDGVRLPFLRAWSRTETAIAFHLSNGTLQINFFKDHTKVILRPLMQAVTYIDETKCLRTYRFEGIEMYGCSDKLAKRLRDARTTTEKLNLTQGHYQLK